jgi:hypothetical protein
MNEAGPRSDLRSKIFLPKKAVEPRRGRPPLDFVDRARDIVWARAVLRAAGATAPGKLAGTLACRAPHADDVLPASSVFYKYLRGESGPSRELVDALDDFLPGTSAGYNHPLWRLAGQPVNVFELGELLAYLPADIRDGWVVQPYVASQKFWRDERMNFSLTAARLLEGNGLDEAAGALGLIQDALLRQDQIGYLYGWSVKGEP